VYTRNREETELYKWIFFFLSNKWILLSMYEKDLILKRKSLIGSIDLKRIADIKVFAHMANAC